LQSWPFQKWLRVDFSHRNKRFQSICEMMSHDPNPGRHETDTQRSFVI